MTLKTNDLWKQHYPFSFSQRPVRSVTGFSSGVSIGLKLFKKGGTHVCNVVHTLLGDLRIFDVRVGKARKVLIKKIR